MKWQKYKPLKKTRKIIIKHQGDSDEKLRKYFSKFEDFSFIHYNGNVGNVVVLLNPLLYIFKMSLVSSVEIQRD